MYLKKAISNLTSPKVECILKMYLVCLFLAHKYLIEYEIWHLDGFASLIGSKKSHLKKMEMWLLKDILEFDVFVSPEKMARTTQYLRKI